MLKGFIDMILFLNLVTIKTANIIKIMLHIQRKKTIELGEG